MTVARLFLVVLSTIFCLSQAFVPPSHYRPWGMQRGQLASHSRIWVLLVAGSNGWYNYRHQADVCHAYHIVRKHGIPAERIVTMMFDDIANDQQNPFPGKLFNKPDGEDQYAGVQIDYREDDVTPQNFLAVLKGNASAVKGGNGRVIDSGPNDHVFVYFTDHGATGMISFPNDILSVKDLNAALNSMYKEKHYNQLVFYLEACESGSMFKQVLPENIDVYAITASNDHESSWGTYCDNHMNLPCLGDLFSVNWMQDSDNETLTKETLQKQYEIVKKNTDKSHVMHYGNLTIAKEHVGDFQGWKRTNDDYARGGNSGEMRHGPESTWPSRDVLPKMLEKMLKEEEDFQKRIAIKRKITKLQLKREYLDMFMVRLVKSVIHDESNQHRVLNVHPEAVTQLECHDRLLKSFHRNCFHFSQNPYALKHAFVLANLCEERIDLDRIMDKIMPHCFDIDVFNIH